MMQVVSTALCSSSSSSSSSSKEASPMKRSQPRRTIASQGPRSRLPRRPIPGRSWRAALLTAPGPHHRPVSSQEPQSPWEGRMKFLQITVGLHQLGAGHQQASMAKARLVQLRELPGRHLHWAPSNHTLLCSVTTP